MTTFTKSLEPQVGASYIVAVGESREGGSMQIFHRSTNTIAKVSIFGAVFFLAFFGLGLLDPDALVRT